LTPESQGDTIAGMDRKPWRRCPVVCAVLLATCGRTPVGSDPTLLVQVVDESGDGVASALVELYAADDAGPAIAESRTDGGGVAALPFPGPGTYELSAQTDLRCCLRFGTLEATLIDTDEIVVIETTTGPCPSWTPESCR
jgi:hypothetical protein